MSSERAADRTEAQQALIGALRKVADGDRDALQEVFARTSMKLMSICVRILKDRDEAEDVLQEVFISIWARAGSFDPDRSNPLTWMSTIARNKAIDRLRSRSARPAGAPIEEAFDLADDAPDGFAAAVGRQEGARIHHCLSTLEVRAQKMIRTAFFEGTSYADLAARAGVPLGTVKSWIRRGLQRLKACLQG